MKNKVKLIKSNGFYSIQKGDYIIHHNFNKHLYLSYCKYIRRIIKFKKYSINLVINYLV